MHKQTFNTNAVNQLARILKLSDDVADELAHAGSIVEYQVGELICRAGSIPTGFIILLEGELKVERCSVHGREFIIDTVSTGDCCSVNCASVLCRKPCLADVYAFTRCLIWYLPANYFTNAMNSSKDFRLYVYECVETGIATVTNRLEDIAFLSMEARIARMLLKLVDQNGNIRITHSELASHLISAREVVSRTLRVFVNNGYIDTKRGYIHVNDKRRLRELAIL
jgi:CRP/FNR family transcriptional regulator